MAKITMKERKEKLSVLVAGLVATGGVFTQENADAISGVFGSQSASTKTNAEGEVFCTYFQAYLPADQFAVSAKGKIDSMSKDGKRLHRTQKSLVNKATSEVLKNFKSGDITAEEMSELLSTIDSNAGHKYAQGTVTVTADYPFAV